MIVNSINYNLFPKYQQNYINNQINPIQKVNLTYMNDTVEFKGKSLPSEYKTVFEYLSAEILGKNKRFPIDGSMLSASNIKETVNHLFKTFKIYENYELSEVNKIKWKSYIPEDIRQYSIDKINYARQLRLQEWINFIENPASNPNTNPKLVKKLHNNQPLKLVIWDALTSEIKTDNRHIPVPFDEKALLETIEKFELIPPKARNVTCAKPSFIEYYTHRLRDNLLMDEGLSNLEETWVKIPSLKHDPKHKEENIRKLEILSNRNWCTRSSADKAEAALQDGDFYIYLKRNKSSKIWEPTVGMTTAKGKIDQIQGKENDNIVPINLVPEIREFIASKKLQLHSGVFDEGPKATQALIISEKLNEKLSATGKSFFKAIKEKDYESIFRFLNVEVTRTKNDMLSISNYKPSYNLDLNHGFSVPYSMFGINENELLSQVEHISGNFVLNNKNKLFNSTITKFPPNLQSVDGKVICNKLQYEKFKEDILRVVNGDTKRIFITSI